MPRFLPPSDRQSSQHSIRGRSLGRKLTTSLVFVVTLTTPYTASAATKAKTAKVKPPVAGQACTPLGSHAAGTSLDCVAVGAKKQWQPKGSKLNPYRIGESFEWTQSSNGNNPGALVSTRRIVISEYLDDASEWVSSYSDNMPDDIFKAAKDSEVRGVGATYTLVSTTDESSRNLGSLTTFWLGDDRDAGCCTQGLLQWGLPPDEALDAYTRLADGTSRTGVMLFARDDVKLGKRPLLRLAWLDVKSQKNQTVFFEVLPQ